MTKYVSSAQILKLINTKINSPAQQSRVKSAQNKRQYKMQLQQQFSNVSVNEQFTNVSMNEQLQNPQNPARENEDQYNNGEQVASSQSTLASNGYKNLPDQPLVEKIMQIMKINKQMKQKLNESEKMIQFLMSQQLVEKTIKSSPSNLTQFKKQNQNQFQNTKNIIKPQSAFQRYKLYHQVPQKAQQIQQDSKTPKFSNQEQQSKLWENIIPKKQIFLPKAKKTIILPEIKENRQNLKQEINSTKAINFNNKSKLKLTPLKANQSLSKFEMTFSPNQDSVNEKNFFKNNDQEKKAEKLEECFGINKKFAGVLQQGYLEGKRRNKFPKEIFSVK